MRDQVHSTLPCVGRDLCLIKQKGSVNRMVVGTLFLCWVSVFQSAGKKKKQGKCHPPQQDAVKANVKHWSTNYEQQETNK